MADQETDWTIMVYIAADNGLANFAIESLKQLKMAAGEDDKQPGHKIVVAAQLDLDGREHTRKIRRLIFDGTVEKEDGTLVKERDGSIFTSEPRSYPAITGEMTDSQTLADFINWVYENENPRCKARRHCLIIWGHGPCLLEDAEADAAARLRASANSEVQQRKLLYMTPVALGNALKAAQAEQKGKGLRLGLERNTLDIIGIDACSMSMIEVARELRDYTDFVVASQAEVPDASFPYERLLPIFRKNPDDVLAICRTGAKDYKLAYQDYVCNSHTGMKKITLSCLRTESMDSVMDPLKKLAGTLELSATDPEMREAIFSARKKAKGFVGGMFVDLYEFCDRLINELRSKYGDLELTSASMKVRDAIADKDAFVVENQALEPDCHGLSIYFPYLSEPERTEIEKTPVKGGTDVINKGGTDVLNKLRKQQIDQMEQGYYGHLKFVEETGWFNFIRHGWSSILAEKAPDELDIRYSAQQVVRNLLDSIHKQKSKKDDTDPKDPKERKEPQAALLELHESVAVSS